MLSKRLCTFDVGQVCEKIWPTRTHGGLKLRKTCSFRRSDMGVKLSRKFKA